VTASATWTTAASLAVRESLGDQDIEATDLRFHIDGSLTDGSAEHSHRCSFQEWLSVEASDGDRRGAAVVGKLDRRVQVGWDAQRFREFVECSQGMMPKDASSPPGAARRTAPCHPRRQQ
jgi:hypothetical protein